MRSIMTFLPQNMAKKGFRFVLFGKTELCGDCNLRKVCIENLEEGRSYEVDQVRKKTFRCPVYGEMRVCRVKQVDKVLLAVPLSDAIEGVTIRYSGTDCQEITCPNFDLCNPVGLKVGDEIKIEEVEKLDEPCKLGLDITKCVVSILL